MQNTGLYEAQAGIKIGGKNINNLRYADNTIFKTENKEELKSLLMKVEEDVCYDQCVLLTKLLGFTLLHSIL